MNKHSIYHFFIIFMLCSTAYADCNKDALEISKERGSIEILNTKEMESLNSYNWIPKLYVDQRVKATSADLEFLQRKEEEINTAESENSEICSNIYNQVMPTVSILKDFIKLELLFMYQSNENIEKTLQMSNCVNAKTRCNKVIFDKFKNDFSKVWSDYLYVNYPLYKKDYILK